MNKINNKKGFTLVELLLVLVIISIILILALPNVLDALHSNKQESGKSIEKVLIKNLELYNNDHENDLWVNNEKASCVSVDISDLLTANEDIKLGECLLNAGSNSLIIKKIAKQKYEYSVGITCGKGLKANPDNKYLLADKNGADVYYETKITDCNGDFKLKAYLNSGTITNNKEVWTTTGDTAELNAHRGNFYALPDVERDSYTFKGWNTEPDGSGDWYTEDSEATPEISEIYAIWNDELDSQDLEFKGQTVEVYQSSNAQKRTITGFTNGEAPYTFVEKSEKNSSGASTNYLSIEGSSIVIAANAPLGEYKYEITATDKTGTSKTGEITIRIVENNANTKCPTLTAYNAAYDGDSHSITVKNNAVGGTVEYSENASGPWSTSKPTRTDVGTTTVYVRVKSDDSYYVSQECGNSTVTITKKVITVTATDKTRAYGQANPQLTYTYTGNANGQTPAFTGSLATNATQTSAIGTYDITKGTLELANGTGFNSNNYSLSFVKGTLTITRDKSAATGSCTNPTYNGNEQDLASGGVHVRYTNNKQTNVGTSDYSITVTPEENYAWSDGTYGAKTLNCNIKKKAITVTTDNKTKTYGQANPELTYTSTGAVTGETPAFTGSIETSATQTSNVGTYDITKGTLELTNGTGFVANNYTLSFTKGTLSITKATCPAPTNVAISTAGKVTWNAATGATGYEISMNSSSGFTSASSGIDYKSSITASTGTRTVYVRSVCNSTNYNTPSTNATASTTVYSVSLTKGNGISSVSGAGNYITGATVSIDAVVVDGMNWVNWTQTSGGSQVTTTKAYSATITSNWAYTANADCTKIASSTYTVGSTVTYAGKSWTVVKDNGGSVELAYNGKVDNTGSETGTAGGDYSNATTAVKTWLDSDNVTKSALANGCLVNKGSESKTSTGYTGANYWTESTKFYNHTARNHYELVYKGYTYGQYNAYESNDGAYNNANSFKIPLVSVPSSTSTYATTSAAIQSTTSDNYSISGGTITYNNGTATGVSYTTGSNYFAHVITQDSPRAETPGQDNTQCVSASDRMCLIHSIIDVLLNASNQAVYSLKGSEYYDRTIKESFIECGGSTHGKTTIIEKKNATQFQYTSASDGNVAALAYSTKYSYQRAGYIHTKCDVPDSEKVNCVSSGSTDYTSPSQRHIITYNFPSSTTHCQAIKKYSISNTTDTIYYRPYVLVYEK